MGCPRQLDLVAENLIQSRKNDLIIELKQMIKPVNSLLLYVK